MRHGGARRGFRDIITPVTLVLSPADVPDGQATIAYNTTITATGGVGPLTYSISAGALPPGLTLNASTGAITGIPTTAGTYNFTVRAVDPDRPMYNGTRAYSVGIAAAPVPAFQAEYTGGAATNRTATSTSSVLTVSAGPAFTGRFLLIGVSVSLGSGNSLTSLKIDGQVPTKLAENNITFGGYCGFYIIPKPSGVTATVEITSAVAHMGAQVTAWAVTGFERVVAAYAPNPAAGGSVVTTMAVSAGQKGFLQSAALGNNSVVPTASWSGAIERYEGTMYRPTSAVQRSAGSGADTAVGGARTVTWSSSPVAYMVGVVLE